MKIKLSSIYASPLMTAQPGSVIDVSDDEGRQLIDGRYGTEIADATPAAPETSAAEENASAPAPENTARRTGRGARRATPAATDAE